MVACDDVRVETLLFIVEEADNGPPDKGCNIEVGEKFVFGDRFSLFKLYAAITFAFDIGKAGIPIILCCCNTCVLLETVKHELLIGNSLINIC